MMDFMTVHVLHVDTGFDPDNPDECFELWHPDSCPAVMVSFGWVESVKHECFEAQIVADMGLEAFFRHIDDPSNDGREALKPGRYAVEAWATKYPATPDHGEEWEAGLALVDEVIP